MSRTTIVIEGQLEGNYLERLKQLEELVKGQNIVDFEIPGLESPFLRIANLTGYTCYRCLSEIKAGQDYFRIVEKHGFGNCFVYLHDFPCKPNKKILRKRVKAQLKGIK